MIDMEKIKKIERTGWKHDDQMKCTDTLPMVKKNKRKGNGKRLKSIENGLKSERQKENERESRCERIAGQLGR